MILNETTMKGQFIELNPLDTKMTAGIKFISRKGKYSFVACLFTWERDEDGESYFTGRFDFDHKNSSRLTNKGLSAINKHKTKCFDAIDKLFDLGAEFVTIEAAPDKKEARLKLYERVLKTRYTIACNNGNVLFIEK